MFLYHHTRTTTLRTMINTTISATAAFAAFANLLFFNRKLPFVSGVEVSQWEANPHLHIGSTTLAASTKMASTAEELGEEIKRVMVALPSTLLVARETLVSMAIIDLPTLRIREYFVGIRYGDESLVGFFVVPVMTHKCTPSATMYSLFLRILVRMVLLAQRPIRPFHVFLGSLPIYLE